MSVSGFIPVNPCLTSDSGGWKTKIKWPTALIFSLLYTSLLLSNPQIPRHEISTDQTYIPYGDYFPWLDAMNAMWDPTRTTSSIPRNRIAFNATTACLNRASHGIRCLGGYQRENQSCCLYLSCRFWHYTMPDLALLMLLPPPGHVSGQSLY